MLIVWSKTELIMKPEFFLTDIYMFDIVPLYIDSNTSLISLSLITVSAFEEKEKMPYFVSSSTSIFLTLKLMFSQI